MTPPGKRFFPPVAVLLRPPEGRRTPNRCYAGGLFGSTDFTAARVHDTASRPVPRLTFFAAGGIVTIGCRQKQETPQGERNETRGLDTALCARCGRRSCAAKHAQRNAATRPPGLCA